MKSRIVLFVTFGIYCNGMGRPLILISEKCLIMRNIHAGKLFMVYICEEKWQLSSMLEMSEHVVGNVTYHVQLCELASLIKSVQEIFSAFMDKNFFKHKQLNVIILNINKYSIAWFDASMLIFHDPVWTRVYEEISFLFKWPQMLKTIWNEKYAPYPDKGVRANLLALKRKDFFGANISFLLNKMWSAEGWIASWCFE